MAPALWHALHVKRSVLLSLVLLTACSDGGKSPKPGPNAGRDGGFPGIPNNPSRPGNNGGNNGGDDDDDLPAAHTECLTEESWDVASALKVRLPKIQGDGTVEMPLTANGCTRLVQTVQGGRLTKLSVRRWSGFVGFDPGLFDAGIPDLSNVELKELEYTYLDVNVAADGSLEVRFDFDGVDKLDGRLTETYSGDRLARREFTRFGRSNDAIVERRTLSAKDENTVHFKRERASNGPLVTVAEFDAPRRQRQNVACYSKALSKTNDTVPCSEDFKQMVRERVRNSLDTAVSCFTKYQGSVSIDQLQIFLFEQMYGDELDVECFQSDEYLGEMDVGSRGPKLRINAEIFKCEQPGFIDATLFHEVMHHIRGPHDENDNELTTKLNGFGPRSNAYTDSIRGCEALCFGTIKTACSCAACFETEACDSDCSELGSCTVRDPMGNVTMSEAVGALCRDPAKVPADMKKSTWHSTMMDCESNCAFGSAQCKSYSLSCDDSCQ